MDTNLHDQLAIITTKNDSPFNNDKLNFNIYRFYTDILSSQQVMYWVSFHHSLKHIIKFKNRCKLRNWLLEVSQFTIKQVLNSIYQNDLTNNINSIKTSFVSN